MKNYSKRMEYDSAAVTTQPVKHYESGINKTENEQLSKYHPVPVVCVGLITRWTVSATKSCDEIERRSCLTCEYYSICFKVTVFWNVTLYGMIGR
jgi:hypothetical protein